MKQVESVVSQYRALAKPARIGLWIGVSAIALATVLALWWLFASKDRLLFGNLREQDAAEIAAALGEWKVPHRFSEDGASILVKDDQVHDVRMRLVSAGIPTGGHVGYELFDKNEFGVTEFAQRINHQRALQGELERTIATIPGVANVRVHLSIRRGGLFLSEESESKASVAVSTAPGTSLDRRQVAGIRNLVASAVDGLKPESVVIVGPSGLQLTGSQAEGGGDAGGIGDSADDLASRLEAKLERLLSEALQGRHASVSVNVRMNFDRLRRTSERVVGQPGSDRGVLVKRSSNGTGAADGGGSPVVINEQVEYAHGTEREEFERSGGVVERIMVAVMLPPGTPPQEKERLQRLVAVAAGLDETRGDRIEVDIASGTVGAGPAEVPKPTDATGVGRPGGAPASTIAHRIPAVAWLILAWAAGLAMGGMLVGRRRKVRRLLSAREAEAEVVRIRAWLTEGAR